MTTDPVALRQHVYEETITRGVPPLVAEIAEHFGADPGTVRRDLTSLNIGKTLLMHPATGEIWMAGPFSALPTPYVVRARGRQWWGNCAWDMLGVAAILAEPVELEAACGDCGEPFTMTLAGQDLPRSDWVVHLLVPARDWYADVGFT